MRIPNAENSCRSQLLAGGSLRCTMAITIHQRLRMAITLLSGFALASAVCAEHVVDFNRDIRPILSNKCFACHGPDEGKRQAGLRLDDAKIATSELESGATAIVPGDPEASELIRRITHADEVAADAARGIRQAADARRNRRAAPLDRTRRPLRRALVVRQAGAARAARRA